MLSVSPFRMLLLVVGRAYRAFLLTLVAVAVGPMLIGWSSYVVRSGSMEPALGIGDVVVAQPLPASERPPLGRVMVFTNPARRDGELLVHRVVARGDDGSYTTAGDANQFTDSTPVPRAAFKARGVLLAPYVGRPVTWIDQHQYLAAAAWLSATIALFVLAVDPERRGRRRGHRGPRGRGDRIGRGGRRRLAKARAASPAVALVAATATFLVAGGSAGATFTARTTNGSNSWTVGTWQQPYVSAVSTDKPYLFYLLDEASGDWASDTSGNSRTGQFTSLNAYRASGALPNNFGYAVNLGSSGRVVQAGNAVAAPTTFTLETWFRTTTTGGGPIVGFESTRDVRSTTVDRQLAMTGSGRLTYGAWGNLLSQSPITSPKAYNDGQWHDATLVARPGSGNTQTATLYVDGQQVATGTTTKVSAYTGWWRIGAGTGNTLGIPVSAGFNASVDNTAIYTTALSSSRIAAHYAAR